MFRKGRSFYFTVLLAVAWRLITPLHVSGAPSAQAILDASGVKGGLIVHLGTGNGELTAEFADVGDYLVHGLDTNSANMKAARSHIKFEDKYGRVSTARYGGSSLPYIDNLVSLIVVPASESEITGDEIARALSPLGVAMVEGSLSSYPTNLILTSPSGLAGWTKYVKAWPSDIDEWPQYLHDADNNCVAQDTVVGPPRHIQWISDPAWTRAHIGAATISSMVSAQGRLFTIEDRSTAENPFLPATWQLIARDAFNGEKLWTFDFPNWEQVTVTIKNFHAQMQRRLMAIGNTVYLTPGLSAPVTALDAATGEVLRVYTGTEGTQEFVYHEGVLFLVRGDRMDYDSYDMSGGSVVYGGTDPNALFLECGFPESYYNPRTGNAATSTCSIVAINADTGVGVWTISNITDYVGCTLALKGDKLVYQTEHGLFCHDTTSGSTNWTVIKSITSDLGNKPNSLVLTDDAVYAEENNVLYAYSLADGSDLWGKTVEMNPNYQSSNDILISAGALWLSGDRQPVDKYDLLTGDKISTLSQLLSKPMGHDRCFRNFITERFFINSKTGGPDCLDLVNDIEYPAPWTRGTCSMGVLPCNGLLYTPPYACQCHLTVGLHNFNVYYTDESSLTTSGQVVTVNQLGGRIQQGGAFGYSAETTDTPWPTYRQDSRRYAGTIETVPATGLKSLWKTQLKTIASAPVIAEGKVFVADVDAHTLYALDALDGSVLWEYTTWSRIDSPPTYYKGLVMFGSNDGRVYCLRASDGKLSWRFRDLPTDFMCALGQLESIWPIHGSTMIKDDIVYFCAGRTSYLDGGLFLYGLNPVTGEIVYQRKFYGPYDEATGFPAFTDATQKIVQGTTADIMSSEGNTLYIRHQAFNTNLTDNVTPGKHLLASAGFLESQRQHREYWLVQEAFNGFNTWIDKDVVDYPSGDIIVSDGTDYYAVHGMPVGRKSFFDPRKSGYALIAKTLSPTNTWSEKWRTDIPLTGKAMVLTSNAVFIAGAPITFPADDLAATYEGRCGAILWAASATDGSKLAEYTMDELPAWDGMAAAYGKLYISNQDGSIECWGVDTGSGWNAFTLGNASVRSGATDTNSLHNLVINETDTYTNTSGGEQQVWIKQFTFDTVAASTNEHVLPVAGVVTPFVVKVNADNDFTVAAVGETRTAAAIGHNVFAFADSPIVVNLAAGETLAVGFLDAQANGSGGLGAVVRYDTAAPTDENWHTGGTSSGSVAEGAPPAQGSTLSPALARNYHFDILMVAADADTDSDTLPDIWELTWFESVKSTSNHPEKDSDGDRFIDLHEQRAGTIPVDATSLLQIEGTDVQSVSNVTDYVIAWQGVEGKSYSILTSTNLIDSGSWNIGASGLGVSYYDGPKPMCIHTVAVDSAVGSLNARILLE